MLSAREPKDGTFLPHPDNLGVKILVLSSVDLISNIGLLTSDALTGKPNYNDTTFNKEPSPDNDEVISLDLIPPPNCAGESNDIGG